jgi:ComF family protein
LFERTIMPFLYQAPFDYLIKTLKFQRRRALAPLLADLLGDVLADTMSQEALPECIIPIPLHPRRLRERGFNQALELARPLARRFKLPIFADTIERSRYTVPQIELSFSARINNLRDAFVVTGSAMPSHIAIIDDVVTTGSTVNEVARILHNAGAERIQVWACARTIYGD